MTSQAEPVPTPLPGVPSIESPFFDRIFGPESCDEVTLEIARTLRDDGFAVLDFPEPKLEEMADRIISSLDSRYRDPVRLQDAWRFDRDVRALAINQEIMTLLATLYGRRAIPFQTLNFRRGTQQGFHSDSLHFSAVPERFMAGVWVALEDMDEDNGPLLYYPGSHRLPIFTNEHLGLTAPPPDKPLARYQAYESLWQELVALHGLKPKTFTAKKGQALIWSANLLHGGAPQKDPSRSRHSQVTHYYFEDCCYYTPLASDVIAGRVYFRDIVNIATGELEPNSYGGEAVPKDVVAAARNRSYDQEPQLSRRLFNKVRNRFRRLKVLSRQAQVARKL
ncbi:MAG: phytanoyl-CoA dioxygenase family protein [Pseudomonadota bacterium]